MGGDEQHLATPQTSPGALQLEFVSREFTVGKSTVIALKPINLVIEQGDFVAIMGHSGSGKTTLLNILGLLDVQTDGTYMVHGADVTKLSQSERARLRRDTFGFVFQNFHLLDRYTVLQNIELALMYQKVSAKAARQLAYDLLRQLGLSDKADARPHQLSGGQAQRIAIARALINNPPIVLADEPTGNLDIEAAKEVIGLFKALHSKGTTIVMVTHSSEVAQSASRIVRMQNGRVVSNEVAQ